MRACIYYTIIRDCVVRELMLALTYALLRVRELRTEAMGTNVDVVCPTSTT